MASSGKKGKKSKGKTLALNDFLQDTSGTGSLKKINWSDEVEDSIECGFESRPKATNVLLPTAPRAARGPDISDDRIPTHPPFVAYISNLPYDIDEEDIAEFFGNMKIAGMRLPRDDRREEGMKLKGYGYVEFEDRASLIEAISIVDTNLKGRRIKIDVATSSDGDRRRTGRMDMGRDRPERPEVAMGDWRSGPRSDPPPPERGGGGGGFSRDRESSGGFNRDREAAPSDRPGGWRDSADRPDRPSYRDSDRGFSRESSDRSFNRDGGDRDRGFSRDMDRDRGGGGGGFSRETERSFSDRGRFGGDRDRDRERSDRDDRRGGGFGPRRYGERDRDGGDRDNDFRRRDDGPPTERDQARSRPKLVLQPRTKPLEEASPTAPIESAEEPVVAAAAAPAIPAASIFGAAKPVDTSARERQIEERLAKEKEEREIKPPARDSSRDNKDNRKSDDEEKPPKKEWNRKRNDDHHDERKESPERRPSSRGPPPRRNEDKKAGTGPRDKVPPRRDDKPITKRDDRPPRENHEREMPKLKEPEPPNFAASNIFASLEAEELSD